MYRQNKKHRQQFIDNKNLVGQLDNCLLELNRPKEEDYEPFFESFKDKIDVNWQEIFTEL